MSKTKSWWGYILVFFACQLFAGVIAFVGNLLAAKIPAISSSWVLSVSLFIANALGIAIYLWLRPAELTWQSTLKGIRGVNGRRTTLIFLLALPVIKLVNLTQELFFPDLPDLVGEETFRAIMYNPIGLLTVAAIGPVCEEMLFRGGVQHCLMKKFPHQSPLVAIGFAAFIFALVHMNPAQMPTAFIMGLLLGVAYWWTKSLIAPALIHVFNNSFACMLAILNPETASLVDLLGGKEGALLAGSASLLVLAGVAYAIQCEVQKEE